MTIHTHDIPGTHDSYTASKAFATGDDGEYAVVFIAPWKCNLKAVDLYFDEQVAGGTASGQSCFAFVTSYGTVAGTLTAIATADVMGGTTSAGTRAICNGLSVFAGTQALSIGNCVVLTYDAAFGSATAQAAPHALVRVRYEGR